MHEALVAAVEEALARATVGNTLVVALSGGVDSVALAHVLSTLRARRGLILHLAHFDHALRPASAADAHFVASLAAAWGLPLHTARWAHGDTFPGGVEAAARAARYAFLAQVARSVTPSGRRPCIVLAHHADDQAETLLLNLVRGSGLHGLGAMRPLALWHAVPPAEGAAVYLFRPLLGTPRRALLAYAAAHNLTWREDESNSDAAHTRNFVRHAVLPLLAQANPAIAATLARTAALLAQEAARLDRLDAALLDQAMVAATPNVRVLLRYGALHATPHADRSALLRRALREHFPASEFGLAHIEALAAAVAAPARASGPHPLAAGVAWSVLYDAHGALLVLHRADALPIEPATPWLDAAWRAQPGMQPLALPGCTRISGGWMLQAAYAPRPAPVDAGPADPWALWLDAAACTDLGLTTPRPGQRMAPLGMGGHTRTLGNIFTDRKVAAPLRPGWPLLVDADGRVVWLCGLLAAEGVVAQPGAPALHLRWAREPEGTQP